MIGWTTKDREKLGLRQAALAKSLGVSAVFVSNIERGVSPCPEYLIPKLPPELGGRLARRAIARHRQAINKLIPISLTWP